TVTLTATPAVETPATESPAPESPAAPAEYRGMVPFPDVEAPSLTEVVTVKMTTDAGVLWIEVYPQAAPNAAARFIELCKIGFYNNTPIFRVVRSPEPFVAQFGVNWRKGMKEWKERLFDDDPSLFRLERGTLAFAKAGPNTNSTQVFINYRDNSPLRDQGFAAFARVVKGMEVADRWKSVGNPEMGLDQEQLWKNGQEYLKSLKEKPNMILKMEIVSTPGASPASPAGSPAAHPASPGRPPGK
ncbi:MAG TPA: peptidylprolyl isomerase, partial [Candidatus Nitrosotenuis sp.]|nr:peptidylprolyl isomerase [Candidatus Nitrosotenuis sp.]